MSESHQPIKILCPEDYEHVGCRAM